MAIRAVSKTATLTGSVGSSPTSSAMKLILVRYGGHENGRLNEEGKETMLSVAEKLKTLVENKKCCVVCADVARAVESGKIISDNLGLEIKPFLEFYAAPEDNIVVDVDKAKNILDLLDREYEVVIAVISREYIEKLSGKNLQRGEFIVL